MAGLDNAREAERRRRELAEVRKKREKAAAFGIGGAIAALFGAVIAWGRVRKVEPPQPAKWDHVPSVTTAPGVNMAAFREAMDRGRQAGIAMRVLPPGEPADIMVCVDETLEDYGTDWNAEEAEHVLDEVPQTWGITRCTADPNTGHLVGAVCRMHPRAGAIAYGHEILVHARGYLHCPGPPGAPTGTLVHPHSPGWDFRGVV